MGLPIAGVAVGGPMDPVTSSCERHVGNGRTPPSWKSPSRAPCSRSRTRGSSRLPGRRFRFGGGPLVATPRLVSAAAAPRFGECLAGTRAYVAVTGGLQVPMVLGSRSTDLRGALGGYDRPGLARRRWPRARRAIWASAGPRVARGRDGQLARRRHAAPGTARAAGRRRDGSRVLRASPRPLPPSPRGPTAWAIGWRGRNLAARRPPQR